MFHAKLNHVKSHRPFLIKSRKPWGLTTTPIKQIMNMNGNGKRFSNFKHLTTNQFSREVGHLTDSRHVIPRTITKAPFLTQ